MNILTISSLAYCCIAAPPIPPERIVQVDTSFYAVPLAQKPKRDRSASSVNLDIERALTNNPKYQVPLSIRIRREDNQ